MLVPLAGSQLVSPRVPTLADAVVALPGIYLLVAEALERLVAVLPFPSITRAALLVAIPAYAMFGWGAYSGWIGSAASAQARQPALDYDEVDAWIGEQRNRLAAGQPVATAKAWRDEHPRLTTGSRVVRRPRDAAPLHVAPACRPGPDLRQVGDDPRRERSRGRRAASRRRAAGEVFVADVNGRVSRLDAERNALVPLQQRAPPAGAGLGPGRRRGRPPLPGGRRASAAGQAQADRRGGRHDRRGVGDVPPARADDRAGRAHLRGRHRPQPDRRRHAGRAASRSRSCRRPRSAPSSSRPRSRWTRQGGSTSGCRRSAGWRSSTRAARFSAAGRSRRGTPSSHRGWP